MARLLWAVRNCRGDVVGLLLWTCAPSSSCGGPNGMTVLCVAAVLNCMDKDVQCDVGMVGDMLEATPTDA
jgi:hypothetical protein